MADGVRAWRDLDRRPGAFVRPARRRRLSQCLDRAEADPHCGLHHRRIGARRHATDFLRAQRRGPRPYRRRAVRHQPGVRDVFLFRLERGDLYRRRNTRPEPQRPARAVRGHRDRDRPLCRAQRRVPDDHADEGNGGSARRRHHRRQAHFRQFRRPHRRRADLHWACFVDQRHDLDRPARRHDHGRGPAAAARVFAQVEAGRAAVAIIFQLVVSSLLLLTQSFEEVLDFIQFSLTFCSFFAVLGVIKMRITHPASGASLSRVGLPGDAAHFSERNAVHDVLSRRQSAAAIPGWLCNDVRRAPRLLRLPPAIECLNLGRFANGGLKRCL